MMMVDAILKISIAFLLVRMAGGEETDDNADILAELPLRELLAHKKNIGKIQRSDKIPETVAHAGSGKARTLKKPSKRTFLDEESEGKKGWIREKKKRDGSHDLLNTSLTVLSYLAFGGYLICVIVNSLRENKRRFQVTFPSASGSGYNHAGNFGTNRRPVRVKHPTVQTVHQAGKKRRKRFEPEPYQWYDQREPNPFTEEYDYDFTILNLMD